MLHFNDKDKPDPTDVEDQDTLDDYVEDLIDYEETNEDE